MQQENVWKQMRKQLSDMAETMDQAFRRVPGISHLVRAGYPPVSIYESGDEIVVRAEVAGFSRDELELSLLPGTLLIESRGAKEEYEGYECRLDERGEGEFSRRVPLPATVDDETDVTALLENGVLTVRLKKKQPERGRPVDIESPSEEGSGN
jgi:HSP20 family protein